MTEYHHMMKNMSVKEHETISVTVITVEFEAPHLVTAASWSDLPVNTFLCRLNVNKIQGVIIE